ncbi:MAG TPA: dienelactone hydrolase family protein [Puia sp.]|nr:dienelactone hydrolase family protein [Puia sp.]
MKNLTVLLAASFLCFYANGQKISCCPASATESFSQLASDKKFAMSHQNPLPFTYQSENGKSIAFRAADGNDAYGWEIKSRNPSNNYLFVIHEWWGLNDYIKKESEQLWKDLGNINVIALDLYDKKVAANREDAAKFMQSVSTDRAYAIIKGALDYVGKNAKIYTIGWCFGGGWSLQTALLAGNQLEGCILYYGMPEKDIEKLKTLHADVLGIFGNKDQWINPKVVDEFSENMRKAGKKLLVKRYEADHAFANPSNPSFDKAAKEDAYKNTIMFLKQRMK